MLDLQYVCDNADLVALNCVNRGVQADVHGILALRQQRNELIARGDALRREANEVSSRIPKEQVAESKAAMISRGKELRAQVQAVEQEQKELDAKLKLALSAIPNMTHPEAPVGRESTDNKVVRTWGEKRAFDFQPLDHVTLMEQHQLLDLEAGARVAGHGFYFLKNEAVLLEQALIQFALQTVRAAGFTLYTTPDLARDEVLEGIGFNPRGPETQIYSINDSDLSLVATAEITLGGTQREQTLNGDQLPLLCAGLSHCFRTEAGAHGKATRGIYRVHQFTKVEMFAFTRPDQSEEIHKKIVGLEEHIFQSLKIPYQVIDTCTGDLGGPAYRKYDLEAWMPGRGTAGEYGEVTSASNCTDYQARRLGVRFKSADSKGTQFAHTLNGTAVACTRAMIAVLENYQQADRSIVVPEVLRPWMGCDRIG